MHSYTPSRIFFFIFFFYFSYFSSLLYIWCTVSRGLFAFNIILSAPADFHFLYTHSNNTLSKFWLKTHCSLLLKSFSLSKYWITRVSLLILFSFLRTRSSSKFHISRCNHSKIGTTAFCTCMYIWWWYSISILHIN